MSEPNWPTRENVSGGRVMELEPCPFCGGKAVLVTDAPEYFVMCENKCTRMHSDAAIAIESWEDRAYLKELAALRAWKEESIKHHHLALVLIDELMAKRAKELQELKQSCSQDSEFDSYVHALCAFKKLLEDS